MEDLKTNQVFCVAQQVDVVLERLVLAEVVVVLDGLPPNDGDEGLGLAALGFGIIDFLDRPAGRGTLEAVGVLLERADKFLHVALKLLLVRFGVRGGEEDG